MAFRLLFVCTGNICRSPVAERLLLSRLDVPDALVVESAGTAAVAGWGMDAPSALALRELGGDPAGHVARRLTAELVRQADLVLTAAAAHRAVVLQLDPLRFRSTFTMREFARLGAALPRQLGMPDSELLHARVAAVAAQRGLAEPVTPGGDDIADPFGASIEQARSSAAQVSAAVDGVLSALSLRPPGEAR